ncbi:MAG: hypothetical protein V4650_14840 [Pseudomonadota bacterium]
MNKACGLLVASLIFLLQACAAAPTRTVLDERMDRSLRAGQQAVAQDHWQRADMAFAQAQALARSVDDNGRWAQASLNLAWLAQRRGEDERALLQQVITQPSVPAPLRAEAQQRQAAAALRQGDLPTAAALLAAVEKAPATAQWLGLKARLALALAEPAQARQLAQAQLAAALTEARPSVESANAHRLLARLEMQAQQWPAALSHLQQAETLDLELQDSEALLQSLKLKSSVYLALSNAAQAESEQQRVLAIQQAYCARFSPPWSPARCR